MQKPAAEYLQRIFFGIPGIFLYNFFANFLRALGNSASALFFLGISVLSNVFLDLLFILGFSRGVGGAAEATVLAQYLSAAGIVLYCRLKMRKFLPAKSDMHWERQNAKRILFLSFSTGAQQSVMNFGILMVQGLVNSFGAVTMAAFAAAVKIDTLAYMPAQDLGNAYSTFTAQNYGAPYLHAHFAAGDLQGQVVGGHLNRANISATAEIVIRAIAGTVERKFSETIGLNLFSFEK